MRYLFGLTLVFGVHLSYGGYFTRLPFSRMPPGSSPENIQRFLSAAWNLRAGSLASEDPLLRQSGLCWVESYRGGHIASSQVSMWQSRALALKQFLGQSDLHEMEAVEVGLASELQSYDHEVIAKDASGLWGLLLRCSSGDLCLTPTEFPRWGEFPDGQSIKYEAERRVLREAKFKALSWVLRRDHSFSPIEIYRGDTLVDLTSMTPQRIQVATRLLAEYEQRTVKQCSGLLPAAYEVRTGLNNEENKTLGNLALGSLGLARYAAWTGVEADRLVSEHHLKTMIGHYGHQLDQVCYLADSDSYALDAQALFALALHCQPRPDKFLQQFEAGLAHTVGACLHADGHFDVRVSLPGGPPLDPIDPEKDPRQFVAPGIALDYLVQRSRSGEAEVAPRALDAALGYYQNRFQRRPDKSVVPWLAEAFQQRYLMDGTLGFAGYVTRLLDWNLNNLQPWAEMEPVIRGAPVNPEARLYGPSCTTAEAAAQMQGLIAGRALSRQLGDLQHEKTYSRAIEEISRYLIQMQFRAKPDLYWLPSSLRAAAVGGVRDVVWGETVRTEGCGGALTGWVAFLSGQTAGQSE